ncbi:hypothetical protein NXW09_29625 [Bacteroides ovatus]|nr:hypothetical protein [Bacteroides ovatus]
MNKNRVFNLSTILCPTLLVNQNKFDMDEKCFLIGTGDQDQRKAPQTGKRRRNSARFVRWSFFGDTANGEKEIYVASYAEPVLSAVQQIHGRFQKDEVIAMRTLARDCFVDGDKELVDDESLFLFGLMGTNFPEPDHHPPECPGKNHKPVGSVTDEQRIRQRMIYVRHYFPGVNLDTISDEEFAMLSEEALWLHEQMLISRMPVPMSLPERTPLTCRRSLPGLQAFVS